MQWGVRKEREASAQVSKKIGQVKSNRSAKREERAKGHEAEANRTQKRIDEIKANPSKWGFIQRSRNNQVKDLDDIESTVKSS